MTITVVLFSLIAGLLVGLLGAVLFIVFAVGVALVFILPVLFFTTAAAVFVWLWGIGTYYLIKWFNEKEVPGIHTDAAGGLAKASGVTDLPGVNGESLMESPNNSSRKSPENEKSSENEKPPKIEKKRPEDGDADSNGKSTGAQHHSDGQENSSTSQPKKRSGKNDGGLKDGVGGAAGTVAG